jgi:hypothetical protein
METGQKTARNFDGYTDHDLLIRIVTLQEVQTTDIQGLRSDCARLWSEKAAQSDLTLLRATMENMRSHKADLATSQDHERRLRSVERNIAWAAGGLAALQVSIQLLFKFVWH